MPLCMALQKSAPHKAITLATTKAIKLHTWRAGMRAHIQAHSSWYCSTKERMFGPGFRVLPISCKFRLLLSNPLMQGMLYRYTPPLILFLFFERVFYTKRITLLKMNQLFCSSSQYPARSSWKRSGLKSRP